MKALLFSLCCLGFSFTSAFGQDVSILPLETNAAKISISASYNNINAQSWNQIVSAYNYSRPWLNENLPSLQHGFSLAIGYKTEIKKGQVLRISPSVYASSWKTSMESANESIKIALSSYGLEVGAEISPFLFKKVPSPLSGLYLRISPAIGMLRPKVEKNGEWVSLYDNETYQPKSLLIAFNTQIGTNISLNKKWGLCPFVAFSYAPAATLTDFSKAVQGSTHPWLSNKSEAFFFQTGIGISRNLN